MVNRAEELIADLEAEILKRDTRIIELEAQCAALAASYCDGVIGDSYGHAYCKYKEELAALKAQPSAGVVLPELSALVVLTAATIAPQEGERLTRERLAAIVEIGHDRSGFAYSLNHCRAAAVPDGLKEIGVIDESDDGVFVDLLDDQSFKLGQKVYAAAPSAKKESE